jgi:hypothetical protein
VAHRCGLRIGRLLYIVHGGIERGAAGGDGFLPFPADLADATPTFPIARRDDVGERSLGGRDGRRGA